MSASLILFPRPSTGGRSLVRKSVGALVLGIVAWRRRARSRRELIAADPRMLADLGISHAQAEFAALESRFDFDEPVDCGGGRPECPVQ